MDTLLSDDDIYNRTNSQYWERISSSYPDQNPGQHETKFAPVMKLEAFLVTLLATVFLLKKFADKLTDSDKEIFAKSRRGSDGNALAVIPKVRHLLPVGIPIVDGLFTLLRIRRDGVRVLEEWSSRYGRIYEIWFAGLKMYNVTDASVLQKILSSASPSHLNKPQYIYGKIFVEFVSDGLVNSEYAIWHRHRKMLSRSFTYKAFQTYVKFMNRHSRNLAKDLLTSCSHDDNNQVSGEHVWHPLHFHAIKIIAQIVMGADKFSDEETSTFNKDFMGIKRMLTERLMHPQLLIRPYWQFHPLKKEYDRMKEKTEAFFDKIITTYREEYEGSKLLGEPAAPAGNELRDDDDVGEKPFRCLIQEMIHEGATNEEIRSEFATFIAAGHETTVTALQFLLVHLALNPDILKKCQDEVDKLMESKRAHTLEGDLLSSEDIDLDMDDLSSLKYLKRCIMETHRITPAIPMFSRRLDTPLKISDDFTFPANTTVGIIPWALHRDPQHFPDPEKFDPDRFLPENIKKRHPFSYVPFSGGPRNCIGYKMAMMEMKVVMAWLLHYFDVYTADKFEDVKLLFEVTLLPQRNYDITLKRRR